MGRSYTPKYRIEFDNSTPFSWDSKSYGRPTIVNLRKFRDSMNDSFLPGGANEHIKGWKVMGCKVVNQFTGETVCEVER